MKLSTKTRSFVADTLALVIFFTIASGANERFIAGMDWNDVARSRLIGAPLMVATARPYGMWRDWIMARVAPRHRWSELLTDGVGLLAFQVPIYVAIIVAGGAEGRSILRGALGFALLMFVLGRPYGVFLDVVRARFGLIGPGQKPMSLGG